MGPLTQQPKNIIYQVTPVSEENNQCRTLSWYGCALWTWLSPRLRIRRYLPAPPSPHVHIPTINPPPGDLDNLLQIVLKIEKAVKIKRPTSQRWNFGSTHFLNNESSDRKTDNGFRLRDPNNL